MHKVLIIDNYDSFTYNLFQEVGKVLKVLLPTSENIANLIKVVRNDSDVLRDYLDEETDILADYTHIILSPGPGRPENAGFLNEFVKKFGGKIPILGVCLGHQSICQVYGGEITYAKQIFHGKNDQITLTQNGEISQLFKNLCEANLTVARYHSLVVNKENLPENIEILAMSSDAEIMAIGINKERNQNIIKPIYGVQFHPESILGNCGQQILKNFLES